MFQEIVDWKSFNHYCAEKKIKWFPIKKQNLINSKIFVGLYQKKESFLQKKIQMANADFDVIAQNTILDSMYSPEYTVLKELSINKYVSQKQLEYNFPFLPVLTSFISIEKQRPHMNIIFPFVPRTLHEYVKEKFHHFIKHQHNLAKQIILHFCLLEQLHIHHNDFHHDNIMIKTENIPRRLHLTHEGSTYTMLTNGMIVFLIDFGLAVIDPTRSNFAELYQFFQHCPEFKTLFPVVRNCKNFSDLLKNFF